MTIINCANVPLSKLNLATLDDLPEGIQEYASELRHAMRGIKFATFGSGGSTYVYFDGDNYTRAKLSLTYNHDNQVVHQVISPHITNKRYDDWRNEARTFGSIHIKTAVAKCKKFIRPIDEAQFLNDYVRTASQKYRSSFNNLIQPVRTVFPYGMDNKDVVMEFMQLADGGVQFRNDIIRMAVGRARDAWEHYKSEMEVMGGSMYVVHLNMDGTVSVYSEDFDKAKFEYTVPSIHELPEDLLGKLSILQMQEYVDEFVNGVGVTLDPHAWGVLCE